MANFGGRVVDVDGIGNPLRKVGLMAVVAVVLVILLVMSGTMIGPGEVGVITLFGRVTDEVLYSGLHFVSPLKRVHEISVRTQSIKESASVPSSEGLVINLDTSLVFHVRPEQSAALFRDVGPHYIEIIVEPTLRSAIREATASHSANTLYSSAREEVANQIREHLNMEVGKRG